MASEIPVVDEHGRPQRAVVHEPDKQEAYWRKLAREAVAQLRETADEIERELNG